MNKMGLSATLAMTLTASSVNDGEAPKELSVVSPMQTQIETSVRSQVLKISPESSGVLVIIGSFLLGIGGASVLNRNSQNEDAKIAEHILRKLADDEINKS